MGWPLPWAFVIFWSLLKLFFFIWNPWGSFSVLFYFMFSVSPCICWFSCCQSVSLPGGKQPPAHFALCPGEELEGRACWACVSGDTEDTGTKLRALLRFRHFLGTKAEPTCALAGLLLALGSFHYPSVSLSSMGWAQVLGVSVAPSTPVDSLFIFHAVQQLLAFCSSLFVFVNKVLLEDSCALCL